MDLTLKQRFLRSFGYGFLQTTLLFANYIAVVSSYKHQMELRWSHLDTLSLIVLHLLFSLLLSLIFLPIKSKRVNEFLPFAYLLIYIGYFLGQTLPVIAIVVALAVIVYFTQERLKTKSLSEKLYKTLLACSISFAFFSYSTIISAHHNFVSSYANEKRLDQSTTTNIPKHVFVFIFDMLSYQQLYLNDIDQAIQGKDNLEVHSRYKNLHEFANEAHNFHLAFSPFKFTLDSIPAIIKLDRKNSESELFDFFKTLHYDTALLGFHFNYCDYVKDLNVCQTFHKCHLQSPADPLTTSALRHLIYIFLCGKHSYKKPLLSYYKLLVAHRTVKVTQEMERAYFEYLPSIDVNRRNFIYVHYPLPHGSYSFTANGVRPTPELKRNLDLEIYDYKNFDGYALYKDNLDYVDKKFGEMVKSMKDLGIYDDALIIITGDHSMRHINEMKHIDRDPYLNEYWLSRGKTPKSMLLSETHVPLLIKLPQQKTKINVSQPLSNSMLFSRDGRGLALFDAELKFNLEELNAGKLMKDPVETKKSNKLI